MLSPPKASVTTRPIYVLLLLDANRTQAVEGRTRLEKLVFLIQKRVVEELKIGLAPEAYDFRALHFGPYSEEVLDDVTALQLLGMAEINGDDDQTQTFRVTAKGTQAVQRLLQSGKISKILVEEVRRIRLTFGALSLDKLIDRVYHDYPEYTANSVIRDKYLH